MSVSTIRVRGRDARWEVSSGWQDALLGPQSPDWFKLERDARAACVKKGHRRTVWRVDLDERTVFAKVADLAGDSPFRRLATGLIGSAARREWRASRRAAALGVPVVRALAWGQCRGDRPRTVFISEGMDDAERVLEFWERLGSSDAARSRHSARSDFIACLADFLADAHERGLVHRDGHPDNILMSSADRGAWRAAYVDLHPVRFGSGPAPYRATLHSLAQLDDRFQRVATRAQRLRFLRGYWAQRGSLQNTGSPERSRLADLAATKADHAARLARHRDRRLRRTGKYFAAVKLDHGWRAAVACTLERRHVFPEPCVADRTVEEWRDILADLTTSRRPGTRTIGAGLVVERRRVRGLLHRVRATLVGTEHRAGFEACHRARHRDRPAPLILGYAAHRRGGLIDETLLIRAI